MKISTTESVLLSLLLTSLLMASCVNEEKKQYERRKLKNGNYILAEIKNGAVNGRIIIYSPTGKIKSIQHLKSGALEGYAYGFDEEGRVRKVDFYTRGWHNGHAYEFYENCQLASIRNYENDKETGTAWTFYSTGEIKTRVELVNGLVKGDFLVFFKNPPNSLQRRIQYFIVNGKQFINGDITYNRSGHIVKQTDILEMQFDKSTYHLDDNIRLTIKITGPKLNKVSVTLASFDSTFRKTNSAPERIFYGKNHIAMIIIKPEHKGINYVRGYVTDYDSIPADVKGGIYQTKEKNIYFQRSYIVE